MRLFSWIDALRRPLRKRRRTSRRVAVGLEGLESRTLLAVGGGVISGFTLIDADRDVPIGPLADGATLNLQQLPTRNLSIVAEVSGGQVGSVKFGLDGKSTFRIENVAPYALFGDWMGDYGSGVLSLGLHKVTATTYSGANASGTGGTPQTLHFTLIDQLPPAPLPNLLGTAFQPSSAAVTAGASLDVGFRIENIGTADSGPFRVDFYLSADGTISTADHWLGSRSFSGLKAGAATAPHTQSLALPVQGHAFWQGSGTYTLGMIVDAGGAVEETSETDNANRGNGLDRGAVGVSGTALPVDLTGTFFQVRPAVSSAGSNIRIDGTIANAAAGDAAAFQVDLVLSRDAVIDGSDLLLLRQTVPGLSGYSDTETLSLIATLPPPGHVIWNGDGRYHVGMIIDAAREIAESDEGNNSGRGPGIDLGALTVTGTVAPNPLAITRVTLINADTDQPILPLAEGTILYQPTLPTPNLNVRAQPAGGTVGSVKFALNGVTTRIENVAPYALFGDINGDYGAGSLPVGTHTLTMTAYSGTNASGTAGSPLTLMFTVSSQLPATDLRAAAFELSAGTLAAGTEVDAIYRISGAPAGTNQTFRVDFFLSRDAVVDESDRLLGSALVAGLPFGSEASALRQKLVLPPASDPFWQGEGAYYVGMVVDAGRQVAETDETNNARLGLGIDAAPFFLSLTPAFPGAAGYAATATGGRGGRVIEVTNLNDSGPGSLRAAVEAAGPRIVVFKVGGTIVLHSELRIVNPHITIAGQTAPGDGITLMFAGERQNLLRISTNNVILRYVRLRRGNSGQPGDSLHIGDGASLVLIDHVSVTWGTDENLDIYSFSGGAVRDVTIQNSLIANALNTGDGSASGALLSGLKNPEYWRQVSRIDLHHNILANNTHRNPRVITGGTKVVNNLIYNWFTHGGSSERDAVVDWIGNYFEAGSMTILAAERLLLHATTSPDGKIVYPDASIYVAGNIAPDLGFVDPAQDNWPMLRDEYLKQNGVRKSIPVHMRRPSPLPDPQVPITLDQAGEPLKAALLAEAGASRKLNADGTWSHARDPIDAEIVDQITADTGPVGPLTAPIAPGGYVPPVVVGGYADSDRDGMPDVWEQMQGFDPWNPDDGPADADNDGWTNIEEFLNGSNPYRRGE